MSIHEFDRLVSQLNKEHQPPKNSRAESIMSRRTGVSRKTTGSHKTGASSHTTSRSLLRQQAWETKSAAPARRRDSVVSVAQSWAPQRVAASKSRPAKPPSKAKAPPPARRPTIHKAAPPKKKTDPSVFIQQRRKTQPKALELQPDGFWQGPAPVKLNSVVPKHKQE